jgi:asparagine synthase (glutamine-hydrolysing)
MCGIVGKLSFEENRPVPHELIRQMMDQVIHRGPDGHGEYLSGPIGLGHRRLSIIGLARGAQPMSNEDETVWVVYNGEIYNFRELRTELEARGHTFKSNTDTEVIVHLYEEMGVKSVERLRGMFAFALWDKRKQLLFLARDRVGIKPLYYANTGTGLVFGSEIKSLLVDPTVERTINPRAIDGCLTYYYVPGEETLFEGIYKLEPGYVITVQNGQVAKRQYWDLQFETSPRWSRFEEAVEELRLLLRNTVKDHMISDVPVGVLLSGGVDSTGILRFASEQAGDTISTFTVGFDGEEFSDERPYARLAAQQYGTRHHEITISAKEFCAFLPRYVWHMEEPICEPPAAALYLVSRLARESSVKVLLSGEGGDEAFGGYQTYRNLLLLEYLKSTFGSAKGMLRCGLQSLDRLGLKRVKRYGDLVDVPLAEYYLSRTATPATLFNRMKPLLYRKEFSDTLDQPSNRPTYRLFEQLNRLPLLHQLLFVDTKTWLPDDLLVKADKMTMATSVELRVPLLDHQVLEFAASLPPNFKVQGYSTKRILKAALGDSVPPAILNRKKTGFPIPYDRWLRKEMKEFVFESLLGERSALGVYFHKEALLQLLQTHQAGEGGSQEVFSLLMLELWHQQFLQKDLLSCKSH